MAEWRLVSDPTDETFPSWSASGEENESSETVPRPLSRSVLWTPQSWLNGGTTGQEIELFIDHRALGEIVADIAVPANAEGYGLLAGRLLIAAASGLPYVHIRKAFPADHALPEDDDLSSFREFWLTTSVEAHAEQLQLVGWYHAHARLGVSFSKRDERIHLEHFPNRWQCALVLASDRREPEGGFFQRDQRDGAFLSSCVPFYEVMPRELEQSNGPTVTWVAWRNYRADRSVVRPPEDTSDTAAFELLSVAPEVDAASAPEVDVSPEPKVDAGLGPEGIVPRPSPGANGSEDTAGVETVSATRAASAGIPRRAPTPSDSSGGILLPGDQKKRGSGKKLPKAAWAAAVVAAVAGSVWLAVSEFGEESSLELGAPETSASRSAAAEEGEDDAGEVGEAAAVGALGPEAARAEPGAAGPDASVLTTFEGLQREFLMATDEYDQARGDFDLRQTDCESLSSVYARADRAYVALSVYIAGEPRLSSQDEAVYRFASEEADEMNRHFDESGCPRPE